MNPEDNNPLTTNNSFSMSDNLTPTQDGLATGGFASTTPASTGISSDMTEETTPSFQPAEEPLIPAAPVPGSIGSVTSVPPAPAEPLANPFAPASAAPAAETPAASGPMAAPEVTPTATPYNPFAPVTPAEPAKTDSVVNPAFQPAAPAPAAKPATKKAASGNLMTIIFAVLAGIFLVTTIIFLVLFINAKNSPKLVYVPTTPDDTANATLRILTCSQEEDFAWIINADSPIMGQAVSTISYTDDKISSVDNEIIATFENEELAILARDTYSGLLSLSALSEQPLDVVSAVDGSTLRMTISPKEEPLTESAAAAFIYDNEGEGQSTSLETVKAYLEVSGAVCSVE